MTTACGLSSRTPPIDFPSIRLIGRLGGKIGHWRLLPADSETFESEALNACELLLKRDARFGRVPQSRQGDPVGHGATNNRTVQVGGVNNPTLAPQ